ncbi:Phenylalanine--tRNA ligase beta subunit [archaeon HR06]|nr:Phenylalanine--tRNA ligase beta subunit [archaeon HR06]
MLSDIYLGIRRTKCEVKEEGYDYSNLLDELRRKTKLNLDNLKDHPTIRALRDFYWRIGIDPTKIRPSSEALMRRFLKYGKIPKINNVVDAGNIASLETLIPIGLYDLDKVKGNLTIRFAKEGEEFLDINGEKKLLSSNSIVLSDDLGILHLFPHRDANRTKITRETTKLLIVACGVKGIDRNLVEKAADRVLEILAKS